MADEPLDKRDGGDAPAKRVAKDDYFISTDGMPPGFARINFDYGGNYEKQFGKRTGPEEQSQSSDQPEGQELNADGGENPRVTPMFSTEGLPPGFRFMDWDSDDFESHRMMFPKTGNPESSCDDATSPEATSDDAPKNTPRDSSSPEA